MVDFNFRSLRQGGSNKPPSVQHDLYRKKDADPVEPIPAWPRPMDVSGWNGTTASPTLNKPDYQADNGIKTMSLNPTSKTAAVALALCVFVPATATMASAKVCKSYSVSKSGSKKFTNISARLSARFAWSKVVRQNEGFVWSVYALAKNRGFDCHRVGLKWRCTAYGRPCRAGN